MTPPSESSSGHIDMFRVRQKPPELPRQSFPAVSVVLRYSVRRYHSMQLALVIGLFACGGLICSMFFVVENDDFLGPRYWPRKSYSSPALATPKTSVRTDRSTKWAVQIRRRGENWGIARPSRRQSQNVDLASFTSIRSSKFRTAPLNRLTDEAGESRLKFLSPPANKSLDDR